MRGVCVCVCLNAVREGEKRFSGVADEGEEAANMRNSREVPGLK
jgi:hypothetical protein